MSILLLALGIVSAIVALEACKLGWHGFWSDRHIPIALHAALAGWLGWQGAGTAALLGLDVPHLAPALAALGAASVLASRLTIASKRRDERLGSWLSGLSSYPWDILGCASLGLWGLPAAALAGWLSVGVWMSPMRPRRWLESKWERRLGWMHPYWRHA